MPKFHLLLFFCLLGLALYAQRPAIADSLVTKGVAKEDSGRSDEAITLYKQALSEDNNNFRALGEMAYSLINEKAYEESVKYSKRAIDNYPGDKRLNTVYVTYGTAYDEMKKPDKSITIYDEGIKLFPDFYHLYFNKGITLWNMQSLDSALVCFEKSATLNPNHPGTQNAIGHICLLQNRKIPALMAYWRLLILEPVSERSKKALADINSIFSSSVKRTNDSSLSIGLNPNLLNNKSKKDNFTDVELIMTLGSALEYDSVTMHKPAAFRLLNKINTICEALKETRAGNSGFFWTYYAPYFIDMKEKDQTDVFANIACVSSDDPATNEWLQTHADDVNSFYKWSQSFIFNPRP